MPRSMSAQGEADRWNAQLTGSYEAKEWAQAGSWARQGGVGVALRREVLSRATWDWAEFGDRSRARPRAHAWHIAARGRGRNLPVSATGPSYVGWRGGHEGAK